MADSKMRLAVVDIDGTLVAGTGTEKRFWLYLLKTGNQGPRQVLAFAAFLLMWGWRYRRHVFKKNKAYLTGLSSRKVRALAQAWADENLDRILFEPCVQRVREYLSEGDRVVLLSGTPDFVAGAIGRRLGIGRVIGSRCAEKRGRFRLRPPELHPFGTSKVAQLDALCREYAIPPDRVIALANSVHDIPLLERAGTAVAVRPDRALAAVAALRGWEILGQRDTKLQTQKRDAEARQQ
jgi:HAD superfamily phosphoserine phosphatase-like hydrolase